MMIPVKVYSKEGDRSWINSEYITDIVCTAEGIWKVWLSGSDVMYTVESSQFDMEKFIRVSNYQCKGDK